MKRTQKHIKNVLSKVEELWLKYPELRLCQLISNLHGVGNHEWQDIFFTEDAHLIAIIEKEIENYENQII